MAPSSSNGVARAPLDRIRSMLARWRKRGRRWETRPYYPAILDIAGRTRAGRRAREGRRGQDRGPAERRRRGARSCRSRPPTRCGAGRQEGGSSSSCARTRAADLDGRFLVIAATEDNDTNVRVFEDAEARQMLCNVVDVTHLCNFILPSIVRRGDLAIAVSTGGASPAMARRIRHLARPVLRRRVRGRAGAARLAARGAEARYPVARRPQGPVRADGLLGLHGHGARRRRRTASRPGCSAASTRARLRVPARSTAAMLEAAAPGVQAALPAAADRERADGERAMNELLGIGISHKTAPVELRERVALPEGRAVERAARAGLDRRRSTRRSRSRPATAPSSTWWSATTSRRRPRRSESSRARPTSAPPSSSSHLYSLRNVRRRPPPLPGHRRPRRDDRRRGGDPGPGEARVRARAGGEHDQRVHEPPLPRGAGGRQARAHRDRRSAAAACRSARSRCSSRRRPSAT